MYRFIYSHPRAGSAASIVGGIAFLREWWLWLAGEVLSFLTIPILGTEMPELTFWHIVGAMMFGLGIGIYLMLEANHFRATPDKPLHYVFRRYWEHKGRPRNWHPYMEEHSTDTERKVDAWFQDVMDAISLETIQTWGRDVRNNNPGDRYFPALKKISPDDWYHHTYAGFRYAPLPDRPEDEPDAIREGTRTLWTDVKVSKAQVNHVYPIQLRHLPKRCARWIKKKINSTAD